MPKPEKLLKSHRWLDQLKEDRSYYALGSSVLARNGPTFSLEEVIVRLNARARTRHRKPRTVKQNATQE